MMAHTRSYITASQMEPRTLAAHPTSPTRSGTRRALCSAGPCRVSGSLVRTDLTSTTLIGRTVLCLVAKKSLQQPTTTARSSCTVTHQWLKVLVSPLSSATAAMSRKCASLQGTTTSSRSAATTPQSCNGRSPPER